MDTVIYNKGFIHIELHSLYSLAVLRVEEVVINNTNERITHTVGGKAKISIPREVIANVEGRESIQVVFILYRNMSGLLPESLEADKR